MLTSKFFGILSFACFGAVALTATPSYAVVINFDDWQKFGDVITSTAGSTSMSNDGSLGFNNSRSDDKFSPSGTYNYSKTTLAEDALDRSPNGTLQSNLGFVNSALDVVDQAYEGSAIKSTYNVKAGDQLTFNWKFLTNETDTAYKDYGFFSVDTTVYQLANISNATTPSSFFKNETGGFYSYTFDTDGNYNLAFGVVDINDFSVTSGLQITNANLQAAPEPISIVSSIVALGCGASLRRRFGKKGVKF
jgi:plastocyanin